MTPTHRHADGGLYQFIGKAPGKMNEAWVPGVVYRCEDGTFRWTTLTRWNERFTPINGMVTEQVDVKIDEEIISYNFQIVDIADVRHVMISAADFAKKIKNHHIESVLRAQAEMVSEGLHIRNLEEVPDMMGDIVAFHQKFGQEYLGKPRSLRSEGQGDDTVYDFRSKFMQEEKTEYDDEQVILDEKVAKSDEQGIAQHLEKQLDALVDLTYVVLGTAYLQFGAKIFNEAWRRVHHANMQKVRADAAEEGATDSGRKKTFDVIKPKGWVPPSHIDLVEDHAHLIYRKGSEDLASTKYFDPQNVNGGAS